MPVTNYVWDPVTDSCLMETDETGATKATYTVEPEPFGKVVSQRRDGETTYYHYDGLGSTRELTDDSQAIVNTNLYDACGVNRKRTGDVENPFQYVGEHGYQFDEETLGTYVRARVYSSFIARWQSEDWSARTDPRKYLYVENRPTIFIDPSGLETFSGEWSRGGDDEERTYETARIHIDVTTAKECDNACGCGGHVKYGLHYHAKVGGSRSIGPASPGRNYGLCLVLPDGSRSWTKFTLQSRFPDRTGPDGNGYRYWYELLANVDLGLLQCAGEVRRSDVYVSTQDACGPIVEGQPSKGRTAELIEVRMLVSKCGNAIATIQATEMAQPDGAFPHPLRCISCGESPYPPAPAMP